MTNKKKLIGTRKEKKIIRKPRRNVFKKNLKKGKRRCEGVCTDKSTVVFTTRNNESVKLAKSEKERKRKIKEQNKKKNKLKNENLSLRKIKKGKNQRNYNMKKKTKINLKAKSENSKPELKKIEKMQIVENMLMNKEKIVEMLKEEGQKIIFMQMMSKPESYEKSSVFLIKKAICGEVIFAKKTREGKLVIKTKNSAQAKKLIATKAFTNNIEVTSTLDEKANQTIGVIFNRDLKHSSDEEIIENLKPQGVVAVRYKSGKNIS